MPQTAKDDSAKFTIPKGRNPAEFLNDADLAEYHRRQVAALGDKATPADKRVALRAAAAAALSASAAPLEE